MSDEEKPKSPHRKWAEFRFSVVGSLLSAPPGQGELAKRLRELSLRKWRHPISGKEVCFQFSTIESWYYAAKNDKRDPVGRLRSKTRSDAGQSRSLTKEIEEYLTRQYGSYSFWSYKLHADNVRVAAQKDPSLGTFPSYTTIRRYMKRHGLLKRKKLRRDSSVIAENRIEARERRSYEAEYVNALWHLDYHKCPEPVLTPQAQWMRPVVLGIFDDHSRLCCHMQWYYYESTENLVHGFSQALLKRRVPAELLNDNGGPMTSEEFVSGLRRLGIEPKTTLSESPYQNGKCEFAWNKVDGRLMAMLSRQKDLTLKQLNDITQAWVEMEYNREVHDETKERPIDRFANGRDVGRHCPAPETLRFYFQREVTRTQRRGDGTIRLEGRRFEIPSRLRHIERLTIKYASWDLSYVHVIDHRTGEPMARIYPVDKAKNAEGLRRAVEEPIQIAPIQMTTQLPPLLEKLVKDYESFGIPPAYLPKTNQTEGDNDERK